MPTKIEEMASKGMGKIKGAKASIKGLEGIFKTLSEEHGEAVALLKRMQMSSDTDIWSEIFPKARRELLAHEKGELAVLYPRLREFAETHALAEKHEQEASQMESLIEQLRSTPFESEQWKPILERLIQIVDHHASQEEGEWFPQAQEALGKPAAEELDREYLSMKDEVMQSL